MSFRTVLRGWLVGMAAMALTSSPLRAAEALDPAIAGERIQRLNATVEALEQTISSQRRQIESLHSEVQKLRSEVADQGRQRPWADDLKRVADAVSEVDRKRIADSEQVVKVLNELRKAVATAAEAPRPAPRVEREPKPPAAHDTDGGSKSKEIVAEKALPYVVKKGDRLSDILVGFNAEAKKQGYQAVTIDQVVKFNKLSDAHLIRQGMTLQLPMIK